MRTTSPCRTVPVASATARVRGCCTGLDLPGPDPDDIDLDAASHLVITGGLPVTTAAAQLGTTTGHVRLALERVPRPARPWGRSAAPLTWQRRQHARAILTREFFDREYITAGKNLRQLEAGTGIPGRFLTRVAREHGIPMTGQLGPAPAGPGPAGTGSPAEPGSDGLGLAGDTVVVFAGDNGPEEVLLWRGTPGYWEGSYFAGGEGNLRTPCIVRWPGRICPNLSTAVHLLGRPTVTVRYQASAPCSS